MRRQCDSFSESERDVRRQCDSFSESERDVRRQCDSFIAHGIFEQTVVNI